MADVKPAPSCPESPEAHPETLTPPPSEKKPTPHEADESSSQLPKLGDDEDDIGEIEPDHYYGGGKIPVFKPNMDQFRSFKKFIAKIDKYGMKSGVVKVVPPQEWRDSLPALDEAVKTIKVKNPIMQEIAGNQGTYRQANIEKQRSYNLPQWRQLCEASDHQPPAKRGERRQANSASNRVNQLKRKPGRGRGRPPKTQAEDESTKDEDMSKAGDEDMKAPPTPISPGPDTNSETPVKSEPREDDSSQQDSGSPKKKGKGSQAQSVSSRRKYNRRAAADVIDEAAFESFDYRSGKNEDFSAERCEELERHYWKSLTYNSPLYGADMPGSLFDDSTTSWNVAKLENLLDVLGQKVPGVNTAYLYLGMWKSTFAWHLEDVDLYSINYIHFGAPKQWYSISQEDARRFEAAMKSVWPNDAKHCNQFLRHKTYLISPSLLQSQFNIRVNRMVHNEGEFVITFPYGYHSGYNLGYNCAESVNFATESWLEYGRYAKKCDCEADSVWIDVNEVERRLRGEELDYEEIEVDSDDPELNDFDREHPSNLPTPPESVEGKPKKRVRKRKRDQEEESTPKSKKIRMRIKVPAKEPCVLCPNDIPSEELLRTDTGAEAHRVCALYTPETFIEGEPGSETICNVANIDKARLELKCSYCRSKRGACFQCSQKKCTRAYHPTCAAAAGVLVEIHDVPVFGDDGTEYKDLGVDFRCRFHRPKRPKHLDGDALENMSLIKDYASRLAIGAAVQMQYRHGDIFAGKVVENRRSEQTLSVDILPRGDRVEVEYKWVLALDPADLKLPMPSANAKPLPGDFGQQERRTLERQKAHPEADEPFLEAGGRLVWSEFNNANIPRNPAQVKVDMDKSHSVWYYLGKNSTEAKPQFTDDPNDRKHNPESNFLNSVKPPPPPPATTYAPTTYVPPPSAKINQNALNAASGAHTTSHGSVLPPLQALGHAASRAERPYEYKPRLPLPDVGPTESQQYSPKQGIPDIHKLAPMANALPEQRRDGLTELTNAAAHYEKMDVTAPPHGSANPPMRQSPSTLPSYTHLSHSLPKPPTTTYQSPYAGVNHNQSGSVGSAARVLPNPLAGRNYT